jgi:4-coumarate--CoA ligase
MPTPSTFPDVEIPNVDLWALMFDRKRDFSDDQGTLNLWSSDRANEVSDL